MLDWQGIQFVHKRRLPAAEKPLPEHQVVENSRIWKTGLYGLPLVTLIDEVCCAYLAPACFMIAGMYITGTAGGVNWLSLSGLIQVNAGNALMFIIASGLPAQKRLTGIE
jgi:hypothetical protein